MSISRRARRSCARPRTTSRASCPCPCSARRSRRSVPTNSMAASGRNGCSPSRVACRVAHAEIMLPAAMAARDVHWARDRQQLWNAAEATEKRKDARVAREHEVALPHELTARQRVELVRGFATELANRYGVAVDFAIHRPHREGDLRTYHAHVLATTRALTPTGLGRKPRSNGRTRPGSSAASNRPGRSWRKSASAGRQFPMKSCSSTVTTVESITAASMAKASSGSRPLILVRRSPGWSDGA
jgi:ATP-dependent exoDNAse (exonuclease V) alpha subunit